MNGLDRTRIVHWSDPYELASAGAALSGQQYLLEIMAGRLPPAPLFTLMGIEIELVENGRVVCAVEPGEHHYNRIGAVHGGMAATLLDSAMGCAVHSLLPRGQSYSTIELKVNYVRSIRLEHGRLRCIGTVIHLGRRVATAEGRVFDAPGTLYAHAVTTCMLSGEEKSDRKGEVNALGG